MGSAESAEGIARSTAQVLAPPDSLMPAVFPQELDRSMLRREPSISVSAQLFPPADATDSASAIRDRLLAADVRGVLDRVVLRIFGTTEPSGVLPSGISLSHAPASRRGLVLGTHRMHPTLRYDWRVGGAMLPIANVATLTPGERGATLRQRMAGRFPDAILYGAQGVGAESASGQYDPERRLVTVVGAYADGRWRLYAQKQDATTGDYAVVSVDRILP
jgi:hypothetical protein